MLSNLRNQIFVKIITLVTSLIFLFSAFTALSYGSLSTGSAPGDSFGIVNREQIIQALTGSPGTQYFLQQEQAKAQAELDKFVGDKNKTAKINPQGSTHKKTAP